MDELVDILDAEGNSTGRTAMKSQAHKNGWFHPTVHIWLYTRDGKVLIQQRGSQKDTHPLLWDVSVAGHIGAGEGVTISAIREIQEEIGLSVLEDDLEKIGLFKSEHRHHEHLLDCEFHHTFLCELKVPLQSLRKQETEVEKLDLISLEQLSKDVLNGANRGNYVPHSLEYYKRIITAFQNNLYRH